MSMTSINAIEGRTQDRIRALWGSEGAIAKNALDANTDCQSLLDVLKRANDMINNSYQCECGDPKTPCPCLEGFLDNIQAILAGV